MTPVPGETTLAYHDFGGRARNLHHVVDAVADPSRHTEGPVVPTFIMALLIVAALALLATSWWGGRRDRDPSSSVDHFHRAMSAMQNAAPPGPSRAEDDASVDSERPDDAVTRR